MAKGLSGIKEIGTPAGSLARRSTFSMDLRGRPAGAFGQLVRRRGRSSADQGPGAKLLLGRYPGGSLRGVRPPNGHMRWILGKLDLKRP